MASNESIYLTFHGPLHIDSAFSHVTNLVHWHIDNCDTSKGLINSMHFGCAYLKARECRFLLTVVKFTMLIVKLFKVQVLYPWPSLHFFLCNKVNFSFPVVQWYQKSWLGKQQKTNWRLLKKNKNIEISLIKVLELRGIKLEKKQK